MEENHEQDRDSEVENESPAMSNNDEDANSDGDSMEVSGYGNDDEGENSNYRNGNVLAAAAAVELMRHSVMQGTHPGLNLAEGHERGHEDILSKLKSQVRDMKVDSSQLNDLATTAANLTTNNLMQDHLNAFRARAPTTPFLFAPNRVSIPEDGNFQFTSPMQFSSQLHHFMPQAAPSAANNPGSNPPSTSPQSSEGSGGSNQNNWSFEEQFKQLYELTEDAGRKIMLDELFTFNQKRGSPINRLPIMAKTVLDLYELFNLVVARGGLVEVINKKLWQEIIKGLKLPSSITSAAFTLRTQYMKFLFAYECEKYHFSTSEELQSAIDGNRREGRRSSYGSHYENMRPSGRSPNPAQMAQIAAVTRQQQQHQEHQLLSRLSSLANGHPVMHPPGLGQLNGAPLPGMGMPNLNMNSLEHYAAAAARIFAERGSPGTAMHPATTQAELNRSPSPNHHHVLTSLNNSMVLFNSILNNNNNNNINIKPAPQEEALNLSEAAQPTLVKRERADKDDGEPPSPKKRSRESSNDEASLARVPHQPLNNHHAPQRTNIVINNREGDPANGVFVSMEVNGVAYQGMLFPVPDDKVKTSNKKNGS